MHEQDPPPAHAQFVQGRYQIPLRQPRLPEKPKRVLCPFFGPQQWFASSKHRVDNLRLDLNQRQRQIRATSGVGAGTRFWVASRTKSEVTFRTAAAMESTWCA